ncbi:MAG: type II secretion system protein [Gammaproteobacteria bacterium]
MKHYNHFRAQAGMTLIELTVVLLVLIGLAGLLIPYVSGFVGKTHDGTGTFNSAALDTNIQRFVAEKTSLPNNMEALINGAAGTAQATDATCQAATAGSVYCKMMSTALFTTATVDSTGTGADLMRYNSLNMAGINSLYYNNPDTDNATFGSTTGTPTSLTGAPQTIAIVSALTNPPFTTALSVEEHLAAAFERPVNKFDSACYDYAVFGIGDSTDLIGKTMSTAPVHFAQQGTMGPVNKYNRFVAVVQIDKNGAAVAPTANTSGCTAGMEPAKFIGAAMAMGTSAGHLWGTSHSLAHSWENIAAN